MEKTNERRDSLSKSDDGARPPSYAEQAPRQQPPPDLSARLAQLDLNHITKNGINVTPDQCTAHLKLLEAFHQLREDVGNTEGLFGLGSPLLDEKESNPDHPRENAQDIHALAQVRIHEKRWAVFVARAVDRFATWWDACVPATLEGDPCAKLTGDVLCSKKGIDFIGHHGRPIVQLMSRDQLPPLDVLMVWHAYMLNPRSFFEDCFRYGKMDFFATPLPWSAIDPCIDIITFDYKTTDQAIKNFEHSTGLRWNNIEDDNHKKLICPTCAATISVLWTENAIWLSSNEMNRGTGYVDAGFITACTNCETPLCHDFLRVQKFKNDMQLCIRSDLPMPGTVLSNDGKPEPPQIYRPNGPNNYFPNLILKGGLDETLSPILANPESTIDEVKSVIEKAIGDRLFLATIKGVRLRLLPKERVAVRRMMSRYWYNSSPFALDLAGAVIRQGSFVEKMHNIDWLHSPALKNTMERLIIKYARFFQIMADNPRNVAVPTLDVDLAWHTHQLNPQEYYTYSEKLTTKYIDHDDKIEETALSDAFTWTSKTYATKYGEPYSECTCWYCEAVRETHTSKLDKFFKSSKAAALDKLHDADLPSDPLKSPHISAHNAVRNSESEANARVKAAELDKAYLKVCAKARKKGKPEPRRDDYFYAYAWGYPMYMPMYYPYGVPIGYGGGGGGGCGGGGGS